jgi:membrane protein YqaA with SNARE-associated domain
MSKTENKNQHEKFSDLLKTSWVKSAIRIGIILATVGLIILLIFKFFNLGSDQLFLNTAAFIAEYGLVGILFATILAGTLVPLGSPALVTVAALFGMPKIPLVLVATIGFTVGMMINYGLAYRLGRPYVMKKVTAERLEEITLLWGKWGWVLYTTFGLIPVLPVELLSLICGLLKTRLDIFLILSFAPRLIVFTILAYFGEIAGNWIGFV